MTTTANGIDLSQPAQGSAATAGVRANFSAIDNALTALTQAIQSGTQLSGTLASISALAPSATGLLEKTGDTTVSATPVTSFAKSFLNNSDTTSARTTLGLGTAAVADTSAFATANHSHSALTVFGGDTGSGGTLGTVPAPGSGDAAASKFLAADGTWKQLQGTLGGTLSASGNLITQPEISNYRETFFSNGSVTGANVITYSNGTYQKCVLTGNSTFSFSGWPPTNKGAAVILTVQQDNTGGRTATFTGVKWAGGAAPTVAAGANQISIVTFITFDGGTTIFGINSGLNFS